MSETPFYPQLFTEGSPLLTAPKQLQDFFRQPKTNQNQLPLNHSFQPKVMAKPKCTKILAIGQKYFLCKQCSFDQNIDKMAFCSSCFILQLHQGHNFQQKFASQKTGFVSCDCGRSIRIKKQKMCKIHKNGDSDLELKQEDMQKFNQFFLPLFRILIFLENKGQQNLQPLVKSISKLLTSLCNDSFYYCSLTVKLLKNEVTINETSYRLLRKLFDYKQFCQLLLQLIADDKFLLQLGEEFMKIQNEGHFLIFQFNRLRRQILDSQSFLLKMAEKKIFFMNELSNYFIIASQMSTQSEKQKLIGQFINSLAQKIDTVEYIDMICNILKQEGYDFLSSEKFLNNILSGILTHLKKQKQTAKIQQKKEQGQEQKKDEKKQITAEQKSVLKKSISILSKIIQKKSDKDVRRYSKALNELVSECKEMESLLQILAENCLKAQIFNQFSSERYREAFLVMLLIIDQFTDKKEKRSQFLTAIWKGIIQSDKPFYENLENIYGIISFLATSYRTFPILGLDQEVYDKISSKQQRQNLFKSYLFQKKEISKKELWSERQKGWLKFENCGKILKEFCEYNDAHQNFVYKSKMSYPNGCIRVPVQLSKNWENVRTINLSYNSPPFTNSKTLLNFLLILFKGQEFYKIFSTAFVEGMESVQKQPRNLQRWKTRAVGQNYIIILLLIDKLCNGQEHPEIKEEIQNIKHNKEEYRFRFTEIGSQQRIKKLLCIQPIAQQAEKVEETEIKQQQKTQQQLKKEQMIKKSQQKRQKMLNKMKEKQNKMLDKMKNQKSSVYEQQEDNFCLSCKEREKKDNQFVNLIHLSKGNTVSQILHADESKTHMKILTNLHTIHLNCFKDVKKKNMEFPCPLCKQNVNCFLPYRPNRASKQTMNICWNVMNAALVSIYNVYETGCLFQVLLISLLQSLTFTQLLSARKSKSIVKIKNKSDLYLIDILSCVYSLSSEAQKTSYRAVYNKIRQNIKTCTKKQLQMFQMVILEAIFFRISGQTDINYSLVENLSKIMIEEELQTLKNTLIFITEGNPDLISSFDDLSLSKISEHSYYQSPDKKKQQLTSLQHIQQHQIKQAQTSLQKEISIQTQTFSAEKLVQTDPQRKTLGISIWTPPKKFTCFNTKQFLSTLTSSPRCGCESENIQSVCLICSRLFCDKCEQDKYHEQIHMNNFILLNMQNLKMMIKKNGKNEKHDVYYNEFMIQYKKMDEDGSDSELDVDDPLNVFATKKASSEDQGLFKYEYCLNSNKFNEQVEKFYNIIG